MAVAHGSHALSPGPPAGTVRFGSGAFPKTSSDVRVAKTYPHPATDCGKGLT